MSVLNTALKKVHQNDFWMEKLFYFVFSYGFSLKDVYAKHEMS